MLDDFEYIGVWWLPGQEENQVTGTLKYSPGQGATLSLIGSLTDLPSFIHARERIGIVLGVSSDGKNITLYNSFRTSGSMSMHGFEVASYFSHIVFVGVHFQKVEDVKFKSMAIQCRYLDEWANLRAFNISMPSRRNQVTIKYKQPKLITARINEQYKVIVGAHQHGPSYQLIQKEAKVVQKVYLQVQARQEVAFEEFLNVIGTIRNLLTLAVGVPAHYISVTGTTRHAMDTFVDRRVHRTVHIYFRPVDETTDEVQITPHNILFSFDDVKEHFEQTLQSWFEKRDLLEPVYNLYFGTLYNPRSYLDTRFLNMVQALESYHRRLIRR